MEKRELLKVMLVDDEPFILQGLRVLLDWNAEGFEIVRSAENGKEAIEYLADHKVDLIIADIKMPEMTGLELQERIIKEHLSDAFFVILSGYADFSYAQQALRNNVTEYILKPVNKEELIRVLHKVMTLSNSQHESLEQNEKMATAYLQTNIKALLSGKFDERNLSYVKSHLELGEEFTYIEIDLEEDIPTEDLTDDLLRNRQRQIYEAGRDYLGEFKDHLIFDVSQHEHVYDVGFINDSRIWQKKGITEAEFLEQFHMFLRGACDFSVIMLVGKKITDLKNLAISYGNVCILRSFIGFRQKKDIYYYEQEVQVAPAGVVLCKNSIDSLLQAIEQNDHPEIHHSVDELYAEMNQLGLNADTINLNINYLLFQLVHLATEQDDELNQEEILRTISENSFEEGFKRGSRDHLIRCAYEYGDYLTQLRQNVSRGILGEIEKEVETNYAQNLTLMELSKKYFVNNAYLGQLFRKKYGCSFRDYLNNFRINKAAALLLNSDEPIYKIAMDTGYKDVDYFVNRFIAVKGVTPSKFRRQNKEN